VSAEIEIRHFHREDAGAVAELLSPMSPPDYPMTAAAMAHLLAVIVPDDGELWVAETTGEIVGWAEATRQFSAASRDVQRAWAAVRPDHRRRGLGGRLFRLAEARALAPSPRMVRSWAMADQPDGVRFLGRRGYAHVSTDRLWALDPATVDISDLHRREREAAAAGYRLASLREVLDRPEELYRTFRAADMDAPSDIEGGGVTFEEWRRFSLGDPLLDVDASVVVLAGERPVALAWLSVDHERGLAGNAMTGTLREHRHRGLARLAKLATVRWAVAHGIRQIATGNDSTNRDMLALNEHLGYLPLPDFLKFARSLR
jgi:GNAT superfamily N-acetyltransferase